MTEPARPYTPATLAQRWLCTAQHVRDLINAGELTAFRVGRLIRTGSMPATAPTICAMLRVRWRREVEWQRFQESDV